MHLKDKNDKPAFSIPIERSSEMFSKYRELDKISIEQWFNTELYRSPQLRWHVN